MMISHGYKLIFSTPGRLLLFLCCGAAWLVSTPLMAAPAGVPVTPAANWRLETAPGDTVTLAAEGNSLRIKYDVDLRAIHQVTHQAYRQGAFRLYLTHPLVLTPAQTRVIFDASGIVRPFFYFGQQFVPLVRDAHGELLLYQPNPYPNLQSGNAKWSRWMSSYFYMADAGGSTPDVYEAEGGDHNDWPDGQLTFVGFQGQIRAETPGRRQGEFCLGPVSFGGKMVPYADPCLYADNILPGKGEYRVAVRVTNAFQGPSVREFVTPVSYDPAVLDSRRQRITVPLGPDDNYWIDYRIIDSEGKSVGGDALRYQVEGNPDAVPLPFLSGATAPAAGYLRINPAAHSDGIYAPNEPLTVTVRVFPHAAKTLTLSARLRQYEYDTTIAEKTVPVTFAGKPYVDVALPFTAQPGRDAYRLHLNLTRDGNTLEQQDYILGQRTDFRTPYPAPAGKIYDRDYVKKSSYFRFTYLEPDGVKLKSEAEAIANFNAFLDQSSQVTRYVTYMIDLADFEILPGVYNFSLLDRIMDAAAAHGCAITVRVGHAESQVQYVWQKNSGQYSFDGAKIIGHPYYGTYTQNYQSYTDSWLHAYRALYDRYKNHPGFQGYFIMKPGGEWTSGDWPLLGWIAGYESASRPAFRTYLQVVKGLTLPSLNTRWGTHYRSWDEVQAPQPEAGEWENTRLAPELGRLLRLQSFTGKKLVRESRAQHSRL